MAPVLFNLYTCLERWLARIEDAEGVGTTIR